MTALITSNSYSNYTADFSFLKGAISRFKPNKIVSSYSPTNTDINFLRNRVPEAVAPPIAPTKTKKKLGERLMGMLPQKKATPKPYSLRSAALDNEAQRKIISTTNQNLKQSSGVNRYSWQKPLQNIENTNQTKTSRIYNSRVEARINSPAYGRKLDAEALSKSKPKIVSSAPSLKPLNPVSKRPSTVAKSNELIREANSTLDRTKNIVKEKQLAKIAKEKQRAKIARDAARTKIVREKQSKNRKGNSFLREDLKVPTYPFRTENWRA